ncbi:hypothetical protein POM88_050996 [Heracleum sosnowskyi]|uniref:Uncharacterized protein n=1 Tax=Heracleum sosnowskyi TaxID=360622 RepID=A0AAD8GYK8_9APIA|nr:hypothetical protein POM88_050996 [Heracleum sosnowskyi]
MVFLYTRPVDGVDKINVHYDSAKHCTFNSSSRHYVCSCSLQLFSAGGSRLLALHFTVLEDDDYSPTNSDLLGTHTKIGTFTLLWINSDISNYTPLATTVEELLKPSQGKSERATAAGT